MEALNSMLIYVVAFFLIQKALFEMQPIQGPERANQNEQDRLVWLVD